MCNVVASSIIKRLNHQKTFLVVESSTKWLYWHKTTRKLLWAKIGGGILVPVVSFIMAVDWLLDAFCHWVVSLCGEVYHSSDRPGQSVPWVSSPYMQSLQYRSDSGSTFLQIRKLLKWGGAETILIIISFAGGEAKKGGTNFSVLSWFLLAFNFMDSFRYFEPLGVWLKK